MAFAKPSTSQVMLAGQPASGTARGAVAKPTVKFQNRNEQYQRAQIEAASPTRLIVLLYDGAIRFGRLALDAMEQRDLEQQHILLIKVQRIIGELIGALNRDAGGEVAANLFQIYTHMLEQLVRANLYDQRKPVETVLALLLELRESWVQIDRTTTCGGEARAVGAKVTPPTAPAGSGAAAAPRLRLGDRNA